MKNIFWLLLLGIQCIVSWPTGAAPQMIAGVERGRQPQVAFDERGVLHLVYAVENSIWYLQTTDEGKTFSKPVMVGKLDKLKPGMRRGPRIAIMNGIILVTANSKDVWSFVSKDDGVTWSQGIKVNSKDGSAQEGLHNITAIPGSGFYAVWMDLREGKMQVWGAFSTTGTDWGTNSQIYVSPDGSVCPCCHPSVTASPKGEIAVMWRNSLEGSRDMYCSTSTDGGKSFSKAVKLGVDTWKLKACPMDGGALVVQGDGKPLAVWRRDKSIYKSLAGGDEVELGNGVQPVVVLSRDVPVIAWTANREITVVKGQGPAAVLGNGNFVALAASPKTGSVFAVWDGAESKGIQFSRVE